MDPNSLIEALRGTMDPNLREAAERQLNEVRIVMVVVVARFGPLLCHTSKWHGVLPCDRGTVESVHNFDRSNINSYILNI